MFEIIAEAYNSTSNGTNGRPAVLWRLPGSKSPLQKLTLTGCDAALQSTSTLPFTQS